MNVKTFVDTVASASNNQVDKVLDRFPLLAEGYAALECPHCDVMCFPQTRYSNGTIRYNSHLCKDRLMPWNESMKSFSILEDGSLKD
jgi:hypothetical protein